MGLSLRWVWALLLLLAAPSAGSAAEGELLFVAEYPPHAIIQHPAPCDERVYFTGSPQTNTLRLWLYSARVSTEPEVLVIDDTVPVPGTAGTFGFASDPVCTLGGVAFLGGTVGLAGAFLYDDEGEVRPLVLRGIDLDGLVLGFPTRLAADQLSGDLAMQAIVTDIGVANGLGVVFKPASGEPVLVSDFRTILPGESAPTSAHFETTPVRGGVAFVAQSTFDRLGVYWWQPGSGISLVANLDTMVPGTSQQFTGFFATIGWDDGLVFSGWSSLGGGFYLVREPGAPIEPLVVPGDITADGEILATVYGNPGGPSRGAGALLVFTAFTVGNPEVAAFVRTQTGEIHRLLRVGDEVDGRIVEDIYAVGASRDAVALRVGFGVGNRDTAIYRADFPEPSQGVVEIPTMRSIGRLSFLVLVALTGLILLRRAPS